MLEVSTDVIIGRVILKKEYWTTRHYSWLRLSWEFLAVKIQLFSKISSPGCWLHIRIVYRYPSWEHTNYKLDDAVSAPDEGTLESFAIE